MSKTITCSSFVSKILYKKLLFNVFFFGQQKKSSQLKIKRTKYQKWIFPFFHHHHHHFRFLFIPSSSGRHLSKCAHLIIKLLAKINRPASKPTDGRWNNILRKKKKLLEKCKAKGKEKEKNVRQSNLLYRHTVTTKTAMCNIIEKEELKSEKEDKIKWNTQMQIAHTQTEHQWRAQTDC